MSEYLHPEGLPTPGLIDDLIRAARDICGSPLEEVAPVQALMAESAERLKLLTRPEINDFARGVVLEAAHQRDRWKAAHDVGKSPWDWFWLIGYLAQKAATSAVAGDRDKALHHTISTAAALANWHLALTGGDNSMRPGIDPSEVAE